MRLLLIIALIVMAAPAYAAGNNFRNFIWGATPDDVLKFETAKYYKTENGSLYFVDLPSKDDFRRVVRYDFQNDKLWRGSYEYQELKNPNPNRILERYEDFKVELQKQYGEPTDELFIWKSKLYRNYPQFWGRALLSKDLKLRTEWELPDNKVELNVLYVGPGYDLFYTAEQSSVVEKKTQGNLLDVPVVHPDAAKQP